MIILPQYSGKNIAVFGLGKTGLAVIEAFLNSGANVYAWDDYHRPSIAGVNVSSPMTWPQIEMLVLSPGIPLQFPEPHPIIKIAKNARWKLVSDVDLLYEARPDATFIGVTGTNGKSTTSSLIQHILQYNQMNSALGGNIGNPALGLNDDAAIYVLEVSSYQLELINKINFNIGVLLSITPDHIERHDSMENYVLTKKKIFSPRSIGVISIDNVVNQNLLVDLKKRYNISTKSVLNEGFSLVDNIIYHDHHQVSSLDRYEVVSENLIAAYATCIALGLKHKDINNAIKEFKNLPHRMEYVATTGRIMFVNDSKATNAEAAQEALCAYNNIYWIAGGREKAGGIENINLDNVKYVFLIGDAADAFASTLRKKGSQYIISHTLKQALKGAYHMASNTEEDITILLSPACSSFDQWSSFEDRGNSFKKMISEILSH